MKLMKLEIGKYKGEEKYNVEYFVWGKINGDYASLCNSKGLEDFMVDQDFTKSQKKQVRDLWGMRGIEFEKGFTIERRLKPIDESKEK